MAKKGEIFSGKSFIKEVFVKWFCIPEYQRPYVWGEDQVQELLDDISYAAEHNPSAEYFLGSIVYQYKQADESRGIKYDENHLLDGQQRLTTILLIMAVIRDLSSNTKLKKTCQECIYQEENPFKKIPEIVRILFKIRPEVEVFINDFVKEEDGTLKLDDLKRNTSNGNDLSIRNMSSAIISIRNYFQKSDAIPVDKFFDYLLNNVILIYVSSEDLEDAFRLFTILNDRGMKLRNSDILKAQNLQALPEPAREKWGKFWEELEGVFGEDFDRFLSWIRTILVKEKARLNLLKEFEDNIYVPKEKDKATGKPKPILLKKGLDTFRILERYSEHYENISGGANHSSTHGWEFDNLLVLMNLGLPATDWFPPLLAYYNKFLNKDLLLFLKKLDNKFSADWIGQYTPTERIDNMNSIIKAVEEFSEPSRVFSSSVFDIDSDSLFRNLEGNVYGRKFARYILLKLDHIFHDHYATKLTGFSEISVEHLLPQTPESSSKWCLDFTDQQRDDYTHKIGNLILLGRRKNTAQGRLDYTDKKLKYFSDKVNIFPNSVRLISKYNEWTPKQFADNQSFTLNKLKTYYL